MCLKRMGQFHIWNKDIPCKVISRTPTLISSIVNPLAEKSAYVRGIGNRQSCRLHSLSVFFPTELQNSFMR